MVCNSVMLSGLLIFAGVVWKDASNCNNADGVSVVDFEDEERVKFPH